VVEVQSQGRPRLSPFEAIKHEEDGVEYWPARELLVVLGYGYASWQNFKSVIQDP
jgi:hypothetical protein